MKDQKSSGGSSLESYGQQGFKAKQPQGETAKNQRSLPVKASNSKPSGKKGC